MLFVLLCVLGLILLPFVLGPLLIHATQRASASPRFDPYDPAVHRTPEGIVTAIREGSQSLTGGGFTTVADVFQTGYVQGMSTRVVLLEKPSTGQVAICVGMYIEATPTRIVANHVELGANFPDGRSLLVNNSGVLSAYARVVGKTIERFPSVRDPARLAELHARLIERVRGESAPVPRDPSRPAAAYLTESMLREMEQQVPLGYLRLDAAANVYRPTWKGAILMCWKLLPPVSTLRHYLVGRRERRLIASLAVGTGDAHPVSVPAVAESPRTIRRLSWAAIAAIAAIAAYVAGIDTSPAGALEPRPPGSAVPADFDVPNDFPGAVRALERLAGGAAGPLFVRDSVGARVKTSGASIGVPVALADSLLGGAQQRFLERGFFLFRHEPNYGLDGRPDELALVPMWDQYRVVKLVGTNGANFDISNAQVIDWLRTLGQDAPFVLTGIGFDHIEGRFTSRIADPDALAHRIHRFCPDVVDQGTGSVTALASELRRLNTFFCWWD